MMHDTSGGALTFPALLSTCPNRPARSLPRSVASLPLEPDDLEPLVEEETFVVVSATELRILRRTNFDASVDINDLIRHHVLLERPQIRECVWATQRGLDH